MSISGVRLHATVELRGSSRDTVRIIVSGTNTTRHPKMLTVGGGCSEPGDAVHVVLTQGRHRWDSELWRRRRAEARSGGKEQVCLAYAVAVTLEAGGTRGVASADFPVTAILGDSLPEGRFRVRAAFSGERARAVRAVGSVESQMRPDEVDLRSASPS